MRWGNVMAVGVEGEQDDFSDSIDRTLIIMFGKYVAIKKLTGLTDVAGEGNKF